MLSGELEKELDDVWIEPLVCDVGTKLVRELTTGEGFENFGDEVISKDVSESVG